MSDLRFLLQVSRPRFWIYTFGPFLIGLIAAVENKNELLNLLYILAGIYFLYPANLLIYGVNDIYDYETDRLNEKKFKYETLVTPELRYHLWLAIFTANFAFAGLLLWAAIPALFSGIAFVFLSIFYSAPPIRAKSRPFLDSAFNILYIMPGVFSYSMVTGAFPPASLIIAGGLWTAAMHAYSAIPDIAADSRAGLTTIAVVLGPNGTLAFCAILYAGSAVLSINYLGFVGVELGTGYLLLMLASLRSVKTGSLFKFYRAFPLINMAAGFLIFWRIAFDKLL